MFNNYFTRENLGEIYTTAFVTALVTFMLLLIADIITGGYIGKIIYLPLVLLVAAFFAFLPIFFPPRKTFLAEKFSKKSLLIIALLAGMIVYSQTYSTGLEAAALAVFVFILSYEALKIMQQP